MTSRQPALTPSPPSARPEDARQLDRLIEKLYRDGPDIEVADFRAWALDLLQDRIAFDAALWLYGDYSRMRIHSATMHALPQSYLDDLIRAQPVNPITELQYHSPGRAICLSSHLGDSAFRQSELFQQLYQPHGIQQVLTIATQDDRSGLSSLVTLFRRNQARTQRFSRRHARELEQLFPHLIGAASNAYFRNFAGQRTVRHTRSYLSTCDQFGHLHETEQGFLDLMATAHPGWSGPQLPFEPKRPPRTKPSTHRMHIRTLGDLYLIEAWKPTAYDELTTREQLVADLFSAGSSQKEISKQLKISMGTVATHVQRAYAKLQVNSRDALNRLIRERS